MIYRQQEVCLEEGGGECLSACAFSILCSSCNRSSRSAHITGQTGKPRTLRHFVGSWWCAGRGVWYPKRKNVAVCPPFFCRSPKTFGSNATHVNRGDDRKPALACACTQMALCTRITHALKQYSSSSNSFYMQKLPAREEEGDGFQEDEGKKYFDSKFEFDTTSRGADNTSAKPTPKERKGEIAPHTPS